LDLESTNNKRRANVNCKYHNGINIEQITWYTIPITNALQGDEVILKERRPSISILCKIHRHGNTMGSST